MLLTVFVNVVSSKPAFLTSYHNPPSVLLHVLFQHAPVGPPLHDSAVHANAGWGNVVAKQHCCPHYQQLNDNKTWAVICGPQWQLIWVHTVQEWWLREAKVCKWEKTQSSICQMRESDVRAVKYLAIDFTLSHQPVKIYQSGQWWNWAKMLPSLYELRHLCKVGNYSCVFLPHGRLLNLMSCLDVNGKMFSINLCWEPIILM